MRNTTRERRQARPVRLRAKIATGLVLSGALATGSLSTGGATAGASEKIPALNAAQIQCLFNQHLDTALFGQEVTAAQISQLVGAANACGITLPMGLLFEIAGNLINTGADPRITCLGAQGLNIPVPGTPPTAADLASYRDALVACGLVGADAPHPAPQPAKKPAPAKKAPAKKAVKKVVKKAKKAVKKASARRR